MPEAASWRVDLAWRAVAAPTAAELALLAPDERERAERFRAPAAAQAYVAARVLLRRALARQCGVDAAAWRFEIDAAGRPWLAAPAIAPPLYFSLAHAGALAVCALARQPHVGVDIEPLARPLALPALRRVLAAQEIAGVEAAPAEARADQLRRLWTLKEAYGKAIGLGLAARLREVAFSLNAAHPSLCHVGSSGAAPWCLRHFTLAGNHLCALAAQAPHIDLVWHPPD